MFLDSHKTGRVQSNFTYRFKQLLTLSRFSCYIPSFLGSSRSASQLALAWHFLPWMAVLDLSISSWPCADVSNSLCCSSSDNAEYRKCQVLYTEQNRKLYKMCRITLSRLVSQLLTSQPVISQLPQVIVGSITAVFLQLSWW